MVFWQLSMQLILKDFNLEFRGAHNPYKIIMRRMIKHRRGRVINISSIIAQTGFSGLSVYGAPKVD